MTYEEWLKVKNNMRTLLTIQRQFEADHPIYKVVKNTVDRGVIK